MAEKRSDRRPAAQGRGPSSGASAPAVPPALKWLTPLETLSVHKQELELLARISARGDREVAPNKLAVGELSPGCHTCINGRAGWLCITSQCNLRCWFCHVPKPCEEGVARTLDLLYFPAAESYAHYVEQAGLTGVGIIGGEPLAVLDRTLEYLGALRRRLGDKLYIWLYTNAELLTARVVRQLEAAGLDEIRLNLAARDYDVGPVELASGHFKRVTIEIPAIPEDQKRFQRLLPRLGKLGVRHVNLHQLFGTEENAGELAKRGYTVMHAGSDVPVVQSTIAALETMLCAAEDKSGGVAVHYCSSPYKQWAHYRSYRDRSSPFARGPLDSMTPAGYLRRLSVRGTPAAVKKAAARLDAAEQGRSWARSASGDSLDVTPAALRKLALDPLRLAVSYREAQYWTEGPARGNVDEAVIWNLDGGVRLWASSCERGRFEMSDPAAAGEFVRLFIDGKGTERQRQKLAADAAAVTSTLEKGLGLLDCERDPALPKVPPSTR